MFYDVIKRIAQEKGYNLRELEDGAGVGNGAIGSWGERNNPQAQTLRKIAEFLEVPYETLFTEECFQEKSNDNSQ